MKKPIFQIKTDDDMSMQSVFSLKINKTLNRVIATHITPSGGFDRFQIYSSNLEDLIIFLQQSKKWIDSGYKEEFKPESFNEFSQETII